MGKKWKRVDPAEIKVGDKVKVVHKFSIAGRREITIGQVEEDWDGRCYTVSAKEMPKIGDWYIRKPKKQKPLTRPDEPPYGVPFRVNDGQKVWVRLPEYPHYTALDVVGGWLRWEYVTEPGDTITLLELTEKGDKRDGGV